MKNIIIYFSLIFFFLDLEISSEEKTTSPKIEVWLSSSNSIYEQIVNNIQINSPFPLVIKYYTAETYKDGLGVGKDIFAYITLGKTATQYVMERNNEKPILFTMVYAPKVHGLNKQNVCGFGIDVPISEYIAIMKQIDPSLEKVYSFYSDPTGNFLTGEGEYTESHFSIVFHRIKISNTYNLEDVLGRIQKGDGLFLPADSYFTPDVFSQISKYSRENGIVLATPFHGLTREGATFSIQPYYSKIGTKIGEKVQKLWEGKDECKYGIITPPKDTFLSINADFSKESGIELPPIIIQRAKSDRLLSSALDLYENNKIKSAEIVLETILKNDPDHKQADQLFKLVRRKRTGEHVEKLLKEGNNYLSQKKYQQARSIFEEVLKIVPDNTEAKQGIQNITKARSEDIFEEGENFLKKNETFKALKKYIEAVSIGNHILGKQRILSIREKEKKRIPSNFQIAKDFYQQRKYEEAIYELEKIILIDPNHKTAVDYLKLSKQKLSLLKEMEECKNLKDKDCRLLWK